MLVETNFNSDYWSVKQKNIKVTDRLVNNIELRDWFFSESQEIIRKDTLILVIWTRITDVVDRVPEPINHVSFVSML